MPRALGFPRDARILNRAGFEHVFKTGRRKHYATMTVYTAPSDRPRLGLAVPKKHTRRAVDRNRLKRLLRETFRAARDDLPPVDVVVICRGGADDGAVRADFARALAMLATRHDDTAPGARRAPRAFAPTTPKGPAR